MAVEVKAEAKRSEVPNDSEGSHEKLFRVYPNPTAGRFTIELNPGYETGESRVVVFIQEPGYICVVFLYDLNERLKVLLGQLAGIIKQADEERLITIIYSLYICFLSANVICLREYNQVKHILNVVITEIALPENLCLKDTTIGDGSADCFAALLTITTAGNGTTFIVEGGGQANLIAGNNIILREGTHIELGGTLNARITTDGTFCPEADKHFLAASELGESNTILAIANNDALSMLHGKYYEYCHHQLHIPDDHTGKFACSKSPTIHV